MVRISLSRRSMLKGTAASLTLFACSSEPDAPAAATLDPHAMGIYLTMFEDGRIVFETPNAEMGQGTYDALARIIADEMDARWDQVEVVLSGNNPAMRNPLLYGQSTGNSEAIRGYRPALHQAGAAARMLMRQAAAAQLGVSVDDLKTKDGQVLSGDTALSYGSLVKDAATLPLPTDAPLKTPAEYTLIGKSFKRKETQPKTDGTAVFGIDVDLPDMLVAALAMPAQAWGEVVEPEGLEDVLKREGVVAVTRVLGGYAVIADSFWTAKTAADSLTVTAKLRDDERLSTQDIDDAVQTALTSDDVEAVLFSAAGEGQDMASSRVQINESFASAKTAARFDYKVPMLAHGALEPLTTTAVLKEGGALEVWSPHQNPPRVVSVAAKAAGLPVEAVTMHRTFVGGGFGRKSAPDFVIQAVEAAMAVPGRPVKLIWTREQDTQHDFYRPAVHGALEFGLAQDGQITSYASTVAGQSLGRKWFPRFDANTPDGTLQNGLPYEVALSHLETRAVDLPVPIGWWRSVSHMPTAFFVESAMDDLARAANRDPFEYRLAHLKDRRARTVLERLRETVGADNKDAIGIAYSDAYKCHLAAAVAVEIVDNQLTIKQIWAVVDVGLAIDPDNVINQISGGILYGLGAALDGQVDFVDGAVQNQSINDIGALSPFGAPPVDVTLIDNPNAEPGGVGETGTPVICPALCNAIVAAGGPRIRELPISQSSLFVQV